ncbi:hypothetical protein CSAL01_06284 [Colletotrichum salicis]|uniref:Uncharacterized protein n=1 Tax=Colletotrichum salicis TaxID=1209931 RepID=A0A135V5X0_9PEZI|nr:hypothetical protein CSAL01_06284 [Colletotrichum salicis]
MDGHSDFDDEEFRTAPSTREHSLSVNRPPAVTQLPGVFVPSCHNGTVIYPTTTQRNPDLGRRPSIVPPGPPTTLDCSLLSNGDVETMTWAPQASPIFRRPSRCMSMDQTGAQAHNHCLPPAAAEAITKGNLSGNKCLAGESQDLPSRSSNHNLGRAGTAKIQQGTTTRPMRGRRDLSGSHSSVYVRHSRHSSRSEHLSDAPRRPGYSIWGKPNVLMQQIMGKVRNRLAGQRRPRDISSNGPKEETTCNQASCQYLLTDDQVQDVVEIVFKEMCKHNTTMEDAIHNQQATDALVQTRLARKPSCLKTAIELQPARAADPATTISEPEPSFFTRSATDGQVRSRSVVRPPPITTIVSRDSITDIRWLTDQQEDRVDQKPDSDEPEPPRHCTDEWLSTPASLVTLEHEDKDKVNMYHLGIDARLGSIAPISDQIAKRDSDYGTIYGVVPTSDDSATTKTKSSRRGSEALLDLHARPETKVPDPLPKNGRRRSAHFADPLVQETRKAEPGFMQQITRKISSVFQSPASSGRTTRAPAPSEVDDEVTGKTGRELGASRPAAGTGGPGVECLSEPEPDAVYQAMVISKPMKDKKQRRSTCSEDYIPHMCVDDLSTSGMPSPNVQ